MSIERLVRTRRAWTLAMLIVGGWAGHAPAAEGENDSPPREPIVLEPTDAAEPPVVRLTGEDDVDRADPLEIGPFELIDQNGNRFSSEQLAGRHWVASFIFTSCMGYCPTLVKELRFEVVDRVSDPEIRFVTISVDPERDTPARLKQFAEVFGVDFSRWTFLTGEKETIYRLVQHGFRQSVAETQGPDVPPGFEVAHSLNLIHVGPDGRVLGTYDSREAGEVRSLRRVLNGEIETPEENRPIPVAAAVNEAESTPADLPVLGADRGDLPIANEVQLPEWAARLPTTNAMLNGLATVLLLIGLAAIKRGNPRLHKRMMLTAFATSIAFLGCYLTYHAALHHYTGTHGKSFEGTGSIRAAYRSILASHVVLAAAVPVLAIVTIVCGLRERWAAHRRIARVTFPIWLYVSVTGVIIYAMLYHWPAG